MSKIRELDLTTKIIVIILVVIISYGALYVVLSQLLVQESNSVGSMMDGHMMNPTPDYTVAILLALTIALVLGVLVSLWLKPTKPEPAATTATKSEKMDELEIIKRALSDDEKAVLEEIGRAGEITQDSLRFRLDWSKAKLSRILTNLDKMNLIQRERLGKTYKVFITNERPEK
jgi:uncharacterized membrane protein